MYTRDENFTSFRRLHTYTYNRSCNDAEKNIATASRRFGRCPRVVNTFYGRARLSMTFFSLFSFSIVLYENVREVKITRQLMGLNIWKGENLLSFTAGWKKKILHGIKCVEHDEITNGGQGRVIEKNPLLIIYLSLDRCDYPSLFHSLCCVNLTLLQNFTRLKFW